MTLCKTILFILCLISVKLQAQDTTTTSLQQLPGKYLAEVSSKAASLENKLEKKSEKALLKLQKEEEKLKKKLSKIDSLAAKNIFSDADKKYKDLEQRLQNAPFKQYIPQLDSLSTSLKFLQQNPQLLSKAKKAKEKLTEALNKVKGLESQFQKAEEIKKFLKERKQFLKDQLSKFGFIKQFKKLNKQIYYYSQQINEYKAILKDPKKIEKKALELLSKTKWFQDFFRKNSLLASMFRMPGDPNDPAGAVANLSGLQTRVQVNSLIQQQIVSGGPNAQQQFRQNLQAAQSQLQQMKNKVISLGGNNSNDEMPEGFKPNNQKTKNFFQRLEYGTNIQSQKSSYFFPMTTDLGLSVGYKLNDRSIIGLGVSYKLGLGRGWNHIRFTSEGIGLRSYIYWKVKGNFFISAGYEQNYRNTFKNVSQLQDKSAWQQSGLIGAGKTISLKTKFLKKASIKLLWDYLSVRQMPRTNPFVFRIGYNF